MRFKNKYVNKLWDELASDKALRTRSERYAKKTLGWSTGRGARGTGYEELIALAMTSYFDGARDALTRLVEDSMKKSKKRCE